MLALSGRPPKPRPARHAAIAAAALIAVGIGCLALSDRDRPPLIIAGIVATILGSLLLGPPAIRSLLASSPGELSIAPRLALRDLVRYQARSGAALAAVTLALGIAATDRRHRLGRGGEASGRAAQPVRPADPRLPRPTGVPGGDPAIRRCARVERLAAGVAQLAAQPRPGNRDPAPQGHPTGRATVLRVRRPTPACIPTIDLARRRRPEADVRARRHSSSSPRPRCCGTSESTRRGRSGHGLPRRPQRPDRSARHPRAPRARARSRRHQRPADRGRPAPARRPGWMDARAELTFITLDGLRRRGWKQVPAGWLVESRRPLTSDQIADARALAADAGLSIEVRRESDLVRDRAMTIATAAGALLALAILALTVGLIRGESAGDLRTLTATGATSRIRRTLTATTAGALALARRAARRRRRLRRPRRRPTTTTSAISATFPSSTSRSRSSACRWPPPPPAGSSPAASRPPSPGPSSSDARG